MHEDEYNKYQQSLKSLEQRMRAIEEAREHLNRRNDELQFEHQVYFCIGVDEVKTEFRWNILVWIRFELT